MDLTLHEKDALINVAGHSNNASYVIKNIFTNGKRFFIYHQTLEKYIEVLKNVKGGWRTK